MKIKVGAPVPVKISVGIPVYNDKDNVARAIESVLENCPYDDEIIISDNGSNDGTYELLQRYKCDNRVKLLFAAENQGVQKNFEKVLFNSSGEYFMFLAADDYVERGYIERLKDLVDSYPENTVFVPKANLYKISDPRDIFKVVNYGLDGSGRIEKIQKFIYSETKINYAIYGLWPSRRLKDLFNGLPNIRQLDRLLIAAAWTSGLEFHYSEQLNWYRGVKNSSFSERNISDSYTAAIFKSSLKDELLATSATLDYLLKNKGDGKSNYLRVYYLLHARLVYILKNLVKSKIRKHLKYLPRSVRGKLLREPDLFED